jgi:HEAT repeat protein
MARPRQRVFGPLFYGTLVLAVVAVGVSAYTVYWPAFEDWKEVQALGGSVRDADPARREAAVEKLAQRGRDTALPFLLAALRDERGEVRALALRGLSVVWASPEEADAALTAAASDPVDVVRSQAAIGLGTLQAHGGSGPGAMTAAHRRSALGTLHRLLADASPNVRIAAAYAVMPYGADPGSSAGLRAVLKDPDRAVRIAAARALLAVDGPDDGPAAQTLLALLADPEPSADRLDVLRALQAAGPSAQDRAVGVLTGLLQGGDSAVVGDVLDALPAAGDRAHAVVPTLEAMIRGDDPFNRSAAIAAVLTIESPTSPRALALRLEMVCDTGLSYDQRQTAMLSVIEHHPKAVAPIAPELIRQLTDADRDVRITAHMLLGMILETTRPQLPPNPSETIGAPTR